MRRPYPEAAHMSKPAEKFPNDPSRLAWASLLMGNWLIAIVAIVYANKAASLHLAGRAELSQAAARRSRAWAYASFALLWIPFAIIVAAGMYLRLTGSR